MSRLSSVNLTLAGEYRDLWVYKGNLFVWQRDGHLLQATLSDIISSIANRFGPTVANVANVLIARNDWKTSEQFRTLMRDPAVRAAFLEPFSATDTLEIEMPRGLFFTSPSEGYDGLVLDTTIYAENVFFATAEGLLQSFLSPGDPTVEYRLHAQGYDGRVSRVGVKYSAINVSAEEGGLHFGKLNARAADNKHFVKSSFSELSPVSRKSAYSGHGLLNYGWSSAPELFLAQTRELEPEEGDLRRVDRTEIVGYGAAVALDEITYRAASDDKKIVQTDLISGLHKATAEMEVLTNNGPQFLLSFNNRFRVVRLGIPRDNETEAPDDLYAGPAGGFKELRWTDARPDEALQTLPVNRGFVIEMQDSVLLVQRDGVYILRDMPVAQLRTFVSSIRHKEVVATIEEERAIITGYYSSEDTLF
jgi:hypothetical protein